MLSSPERPTRLRRVPARRGFTLAELVVALLLFSIVGGGILTLMMRQQRFYRSTADIIQLQGQLRQGGSVVPLDLRGMSTSDTTANGIVNGRAANYNADVYAKTNQSIDFRRVFGSSMLCAKLPATPSTIVIYPNTLDSTLVLTTWAATPQLGDSLLILDEGKMISTIDDRWRVYEVRSMATGKGNKGCPWKLAATSAAPADSSPLLYASDTVRVSYRIGLDRAIATGVQIGAPLR